MIFLATFRPRKKLPVLPPNGSEAADRTTTRPQYAVVLEPLQPRSHRTESTAGRKKRNRRDVRKRNGAVLNVLFDEKSAKERAKYIYLKQHNSFSFHNSSRALCHLVNCPKIHLNHQADFQKLAQRRCQWKFIKCRKVSENLRKSRENWWEVLHDLHVKVHARGAHWSLFSTSTTVKKAELDFKFA